MANAFDSSSRTWLVDTASATTVDANDVQVSGIVYAPSAAAQTAEIQDPSTSAVLWRAVSTTGDTVVDNTMRRWVRGFKVPTLTASGKLTITYR